MNTVIHRYLQETHINNHIGGQPPGFADFLRGTIALYQYARKYNYSLKFDIDSHPIFKFLNIPQQFATTTDENVNTIEIIPPVEYYDMDSMLDSLFSKNETFNILTNAFYKENNDMTDEYAFARSFLKPSNQLYNYIEIEKNSNELDFDNPYITIHVRLGDQYLVNKNSPNDNLINRIRHLVNQIRSNESEKQILFIADSKELKKSLKDLCFITTTEPIHTGSLDKDRVDNRIISTLCDFFLMSTSEKIYCLNYWDGSGFSRICAKIFGKQYIPINL